MSGRRDHDGMTAAQARRVALAVIGLCIVAIAMIFQPYSMTGFSIGDRVQYRRRRGRVGRPGIPTWRRSVGPGCLRALWSRPA